MCLDWCDGEEVSFGRSVISVEIIVGEALAEAVRPLKWELDGIELVKVVQRRDFADALQYVNAVGALAEQAGHHPDIDIRYSRVRLALVTHSEGGITEKDAAMAEQLNRIN